MFFTSLHTDNKITLFMDSLEKIKLWKKSNGHSLNKKQASSITKTEINHKLGKEANEANYLTAVETPNTLLSSFSLLKVLPDSRNKLKSENGTSELVSLIKATNQVF